MLAVLLGAEALESGHHQVHGHLQFVVFCAVVILEFGDVGGPGFTDQHGAVFVGDRAQLAHGVVHFGKFFVVLFDLIRAAKFIRARSRRIVRERGIFVQSIDGVEAESGDAALVPETCHVEHGFFHGGIAPIQIGLLRIKVVVVILICFCIEGPSRSSECGQPIIWRPMGALAIAPDVPVAMLGGFCGFGVEKPFVLVGRVIDDEVENDFDVVFFSVSDEFVEIGKRTVHGIDGVVVGNVVAEINLRRREARGNPNGVDAELFQVIEVRGDTV